jgi:DNA-binding Lrp family transcriptional regulator
MSTQLTKSAEKKPSPSKPKIDRLDLRMLALLCKRGRESITDVAKQIGLSPTPCSTRLESLESAGVVVGFQADVDLERLAALDLFCVTLALKTWSPALACDLESLIQASPYIVGCDSVLGSIDYVMWVYCRSIAHYNSIMAPFRAYELDYTTFPVSKRIMRMQLHRLLAELAKDSL